ncbi:MAG: ATP-binding protein, partial [Dehalococcoidia bacterium]|nr:ATP-binding protein [Dehalococcoidia bacterium]
MMEHIGDILKRQTQTNTSRANTDTQSGADEDTAPVSDCPLCRGAGFVHPRSSAGKPDFSRVVPCRCARETIEKERASRLRGYSNLGALARFTFDSLVPHGRSGNAASQQLFIKAFEAAKAFAAEPKGWLVLAGPSGSGKTHLAAAIVNERIKRNSPAFFQSIPDLLDHLRSAFTPGSEMPYDELFDRICNAPLLVLDDMGIQASTPWANEKLNQLLNHRFNA